MELEKEDDLFDVVDEDEYAQIVQKRRLEAGELHSLPPSPGPFCLASIPRRASGDFVVDDDGQGIYDMGEDDDMFYGEVPICEPCSAP